MSERVSRAAYFGTLRSRSRLQYDTWALRSETTGEFAARRAKLLGTLQYFGAQDKFEALAARLHTAAPVSSFSEDLSELTDQLSEDLIGYLDETCHDKYRRAQFGFLPLGGVDAFCLNQDDDGHILDGYLVCLNEGLYLCSQLLAKGFVLENMQGDWAMYRQSGAASFTGAIEHLLAPSPHNANAMFFEGLPPDINGAVSGAQSAMAILILQFVCLHEIGHIILDHFPLMAVNHFHIVGLPQPKPAAVPALWDAEYAADQFALDAICRHAGTDTSKWANSITIHVFLHWLSRIEERLGNISSVTHPPAAMRAARLRALMRASVSSAAEIERYLARTDDILAAWTEADRRHVETRSDFSTIIF